MTLKFLSLSLSSLPLSSSIKVWFQNRQVLNVCFENVFNSNNVSFVHSLDVQSCGRRTTRRKDQVVPRTTLIRRLVPVIRYRWLNWKQKRSECWERVFGIIERSIEWRGETWIKIKIDFFSSFNFSTERERGRDWQKQSTDKRENFAQKESLLTWNSSRRTIWRSIAAL